MNQKIKKLIIITLAIILLIVGYFILLQKPETAAADWWDDSWLYRQTVGITNSGTDQTDFQAMITVDTATLITANKMQADCDDIRLTDINGKLIPHWMEPGTCNSAATKIWTKVPSISTSGDTVYLYYGNSAVNSTSSLDNIFIREISGVQGAWDMDGTGTIATNDTLADSSGNTNTGTASNINTTGMAYASSQFEQGVDFDGVDDYVDVTGITTGTSHTISAWINTGSITGSSNRILDSESGRVIFDVSSGGYLRYFDGSSWHTSTTNPVTDGNWHHVTTVSNSSDLTIYIDGNDIFTDNIVIKSIGGTVRIGSHWTGISSYFFNGSIDDVRVYNTTLTQSEISDLYGTGGDRHGYVTTNYPNKSLVRKYSASVSVGSPGSEERGPGPVAYWKFDEGFGQTANDSTINANNGTLGATSGVENSDPTWQTEDMCISGKCLKFDGVDDKTTVTDDNALDITDAITLSSWVNVTASPEYTALVDDLSTTGDFTHRKEITITTTGTSTPANYQVKLTITHETAMNTSFEDIRFNTKAGGYIDYWIESHTDDTTADVWIELPDAITDPGSDTLWIYYGNVGLSDGGDGDDTFEFFDDFEGSSLDGSKWSETGTGTTTVSNSKVNINSTAENGYKTITSTSSFGLGYALRSYAKFNTGGDNDTVYLAFHHASLNEFAYIREKDNYCGTKWCFYSGNTSGDTLLYSDEDRDHNYHIFKLSRVSSSSVKFQVDNGTLKTSTVYNSSSTIPIVALTRNTGDYFEADWIFVHQCIADEPTPTYGTEVSSASQAIISKLDSYFLGANSTTAYATINNQTISSSISSGWNYLTLTYNKDAGGTEEMKLYINGTEAATGDYSTVIATNTNNVLLGNAFNGFIDSVKIYPYARTAAQIKTDYASRGTTSGVSASLGKAPEGGGWMTDGLVGYWKMDEASWTNDCSTESVIDSSGAGNHGSACPNATGPTGGAAGKFGNGGLFDGSDDYVDAGTDSSLRSTGDMTVVAWIKINLISGTDGIVGGRSGFNDYTMPYSLRHSDTFSFHLGEGSSVATASGGTVVVGEWAHIVGVISGNDVKVYKNGIEVGNDVFSGTRQTGTRIVIGADETSSGFSDSSLDEVRIYNHAFSPGEVRDLYNFAPGPVGWWKMDEKVSGNGQTINDSSGYGNTGTTDDGANNTGMDCMVSGKYGSACEFDGVDDYVTATLPNVFDDIPNNDFTVSFWANTPEIEGSGTFIRLMDIHKDASNYVQFTGSNIANTLQLGVVDAGTLRKKAYNSVPTNQWFFVTGIWNASGNEITLYIDGNVVSDATAGTQTAGGNSGIYIGCRGDNNAYFNGSIDDVRIYNYARTQAQIMEDYNAGKKRGKPIGHWKFDEGYGTTANNSGIGGSALNGTLTNMASPATSTSGWTDEGKMGKGLVFDGGNDYVDMGDKDIFSFTDGSNDLPFSLNVWINATAFDGLNGINWIISKDGGPSEGVWRREWALVVLYGKPRITLKEFDNSNGISRGYDTALNTDQWYHIVATYDGSETEAGLRLYIDGLKVDDTSLLSDTYTGMTNNDRKVYVGYWNHYTGADYFFNGSIDDVKIYNYALTEDEVREEYNQGALLKLGSTGTDSSGNADDSQSREYCIPGDATSCNPPVGRWDFNEGAGSTVNDISGNANTGTWNGTGSHWTTGKIGKGGSFNGSDDYVLVPDSSSLSFGAGSSVTFSVWVKSASFQSSGSKIVEKKEVGNEYIVIQAYPTSNVAFFSLRDSNGIWVNEGGTTLINDNQWHHLTGVKNGNNVYIYVDGSLEGSNNASFTGNWNDGDIRVGTSVDGGARYVDGSIDQVRIYNYARTPAQIAWDYNRGKPIAHWKFDECQGGTAYDSSGNANNGTITIGATVPQTALGTCTSGASTDAWYNGRTGKYNSGMSFDGVDDYVNCGSGSSIDNIFSGGGTISVWFRADSKGESDYPRILNKRTELPTYGWSFFVADNDNRKIEFSNTFTGDNAQWRTTSSTTYGNWYHGVVVYNSDSVNNDPLIYINGVLQSITEIATPTGTSDSDASGNLLIGERADFTRAFDGLIDEVKIYNYALTPLQVKTKYNGGAVNFR